MVYGKTSMDTNISKNKRLPGGRPRLDSNPDWWRHFLEVYGHVQAGNIGKREGARRLAIGYSTYWHYEKRMELDGAL